MADLDFDADTVQGAFDYFCQRNIQLRSTGWDLRSMMALGEGADTWGVLARFENGGAMRFAVYVLASHRGKGLLSTFLRANHYMKFITVDDCNVAGFYKKHGRDCLVLPSSK